MKRRSSAGVLGNSVWSRSRLEAAALKLIIRSRLNSVLVRLKSAGLTFLSREVSWNTPTHTHVFFFFLHRMFFALCFTSLSEVIIIMISVFRRLSILPFDPHLHHHHPYLNLSKPDNSFHTLPATIKANCRELRWPANPKKPDSTFVVSENTTQFHSKCEADCLTGAIDRQTDR